MPARHLALAAVLAAPAAALAQDAPTTWDAYQERYVFSCVGPVASMAKPETREVGGYSYEFSGATAKVRRKDGRAVAGEVRFGVLAAIKDFLPETKFNLDTFLEKFKAANVEGIIIGGDTGYEEQELVDIFSYFGETKLPVYVVIGNTESRTAYNRAVRQVSKDKPNVVNLDLARRVDLEGVDLLSLPGYFDKRFVHQSASCVYRPADLDTIPVLAKQADDPMVLVTHGPPKQDSKVAVDYVPDAGNVGDPGMAERISDAGIMFGIHGHILEAGGKATDFTGRQVLPAGKFHKSLFLNPGSANSIPWRMNDGKDSYGLAALLTIKGKEAKYDVIAAPHKK